MSACAEGFSAGNWNAECVCPPHASLYQVHANRCHCRLRGLKATASSLGLSGQQPTKIPYEQRAGGFRAPPWCWLMNVYCWRALCRAGWDDGQGKIVALDLPVPLVLDQPERPEDTPQNCCSCVIERRGSAAECAAAPSSSTTRRVHLAGGLDPDRASRAFSPCFLAGLARCYSASASRFQCRNVRRSWSRAAGSMESSESVPSSLSVWRIWPR